MWPGPVNRSLEARSGGPLAPAPATPKQAIATALTKRLRDEARPASGVWEPPGRYPAAGEKGCGSGRRPVGVGQVTPAGTHDEHLADGGRPRPYFDVSGSSSPRGSSHGSALNSGVFSY